MRIRVGDKAITASAPAVIKLFGEHSVIFGKTCVGLPISLFASATVSNIRSKNVRISLDDYKIEYEASSERIRRQFLLYNKSDLTDYMNKSRGVPRCILPYLTILSRIYSDYGIELEGCKLSIHSKIPQSKGLGSSAATSTAFTVAVLSTVQKKIPDESIIDIARDGERIIHRFKNGGMIDVPASYFGGCISYNLKVGFKKNPFKNITNFMLADTGTTAETYRMIGKVQNFYKKKTKIATSLLNQMNSCSVGGLTALKKGDKKEIGRLMNRNQALLKRFGVSSARIDRIVEVAMKNGAFGAKLTGKGGGGVVVILAQNDSKLRAAIGRMDYKLYSVDLSDYGAKLDYLRYLDG